MTLNIRRIDSQKDDLRAEMDLLRGRLSPRGDVVSQAGRQRTIEIFGEALSPVEVVERILKDVAEKGLEAVLDYTRRIDRAELTPETIRVSAEELAEAHAGAEIDFLETIRSIRGRIREYQSTILHQDIHMKRYGGFLAEWYRPLRRIGICVPGGAAAYPSTVLMTAVPAQVAGVKELAVVAPPTPFGSYNQDLLATCHELGITEVYRLGGAQAVAAMAYGVEGLPRVDKIVGPGNLFVALAKQRVFGQCDIDSIAGPSEVVVIVDSSTNARYTAYDLMAQAEHSPGASILIGWDADVLDAAVAQIDKELGNVERGELARQSLEEFGAVILAKDEEEACELTDLIAPEHLHIATENPETLARKIRNAGAMFLGNYTPVALGDYAAGPSHVLPTSGTARFARGLSSNDFLRPHSVLHFDQAGLTEMARDVEILATKEGLTAHRESVTIRKRTEDR